MDQYEKKREVSFVYFVCSMPFNLVINCHLLQIPLYFLQLHFLVYIFF